MIFHVLNGDHCANWCVEHPFLDSGNVQNVAPILEWSATLACRNDECCLCRELSEIADHLASALGVPSTQKEKMSSGAHVTLAVLQKEIDSAIVALEETIKILEEVQEVIENAQKHGTDDTEVQYLYSNHLGCYIVFCLALLINSFVLAPCYTQQR